MTGDEKNMATHVDSLGGLWTVTPNGVLSNCLDITQHTDEGPVALTIPTNDAVALAAKVKAVAQAEILDAADRAIDAAEVEPKSVMGERRTGRFDINDRVAWTLGDLEYTGTVRDIDRWGAREVHGDKGGVFFFPATGGRLRPAPTPAAPTTDGTCNHGGEGDEADDADESGIVTAHVGEVS